MVFATAALFSSVVFSSGVDRANAQSGPTNPADETINKRPYVLILMDSSASMEWTDAGAGQYPSREAAYEAFDGESDPYSNQPDNFRPDMSMGIADSGDSDVDDSQPNTDPLMFGSCYVWEPPCSSYERPSWDAQNFVWTPSYDVGGAMRARLDDMRDTTGDKPVRLMNFSQPRHVTFKEILTGEMILGTDSGSSPSTLNWQRYGPGCWFVPRQRDASYVEDPICCQNEQTITQPDGSTETVCADGYPAYEQFPDTTDPRPHMQEVFDTQIETGLMDHMKTQMHFAVTSFDSYKFPMDGSPHSTNEIDGEDTVQWDPNALQDSYPGADAEDPYNLGVYRIAGPKSFPSKESDIEAINNLAEQALRDSGTLKADAETDSSFEVGPVGTYADSFQLSRQPVAKNTPLAPAVHDIHDYFLSPEGPLYDDPYNGHGCRRKHTILMTDGLPLPEAPASGPECVDIGQEGLSEAFAVNRDQYDYACTEREILDFVTDPNIYLQNGGTSDGLAPRSHVVGINQSDWSATHSTGGSTTKPPRVRKLASMADAGKTCAGWYLGNRNDVEEQACGSVTSSAGRGPWIPLVDQPAEYRNEVANEYGSLEGYCPRTDHPCLVKQYPNESEGPSPDFRSFGAPEACPPDGWDGCNYPAVILTCNTVDQNIDRGLSEADARADFRECRSGKWSAKALQQIFNSIVGASGVASRTEAAVANELDDEDNGQYRLYSGVRVESGHPMWRGILFRETRRCKHLGNDPVIPPDEKEDPCADGNEFYQCFHEEVGEKIVRNPATGAATEDNRRIFTSVPGTRVFDYENGYARELSSSPIDDSCGLFHSNFYLQKENEDRGEFQDSHLDDDGGEDLLLHRRIPFSWETLEGALVGDDNDDWPLGDTDAGDGDNSSTETLENYLNTSSVGEAKKLIEYVRGQVVARERRELGAILNSNPATVEPPKQDIPIESYRAFKERFQRRPTMLYFATMDGVLHGMYTGVMEAEGGVVARSGMDTEEGEVFTNDPYSNLGGKQNERPAAEQREAWAYLPHMLHDNLSGNFTGKNPNLMDGTPTVKNVRLCHSNPANNQNMQACNVSTSSSGSLGSTCSSAGSNTVPASEQWRTTLVQGLGQAGSGYFALDITRPGGATSDRDDVEVPDPVPLWEFDPFWERGQVEAMFEDDSTFPTSGRDLVCPPGGCNEEPTESGNDMGKCNDAEEYWNQPFMGRSVSRAAIGTVILPAVPGLGDDASPIRRPVAIFGAGNSSAGEEGCGEGKQLGKAVYVVDLQTGSILRRFTGYFDESGTWHSFESEVVGTPAVFSGEPGRLATRGFIGDARGRMFRIDFSGDPNANEKWNPAHWTLEMFFDPDDEFTKSDFGTSPVEFGAAQLKPAVARDDNDNLVVVYGLGVPNDTASEDLAHLMVAAREQSETITGSKPGKYLWHVGPDQGSGFQGAEKVTGDPVIFNNAAYFTSYSRNNSDVCKQGASRVWGVDFAFESSSGSTLPSGVFDCDSNPDLHPDDCGSTDPDTGLSRFFRPAENAVVQGLTITLGPACSPETDPEGDYATLQGENQQQQPELIVQTGGNEPGSDSSGGGGGGGGSGGGSGSSGESDFVHRKSVGLQENFDRTIPLSWSVVN